MMPKQFLVYNPKNDHLTISIFQGLMPKPSVLLMKSPVLLVNRQSIGSLVQKISCVFCPILEHTITHPLEKSARYIPLYLHKITLKHLGRLQPSISWSTLDFRLAVRCRTAPPGVLVALTNEQLDTKV